MKPGSEAGRRSWFIEQLGTGLEPWFIRPERSRAGTLGPQAHRGRAELRPACIQHPARISIRSAADLAVDVVADQQTLQAASAACSLQSHGTCQVIPPCACVICGIPMRICRLLNPCAPCCTCLVQGLEDVRTGQGPQVCAGEGEASDGSDR